MNFESFAEQHGLIIDHIEHDRWVRVPTTDKPYSKNGAYIWDGKMGAVQNWAVHEKPITFLSKDDFRITESEWRKKKDKLEEDRKRKNNLAIKTANEMLTKAVKSTHPYMAKKGFPDFKVPVYDGLMLLPMRIGQNLVGCQTISQDGTKKFLYGQITKDAELVIDAKGRHILCEGYATAMSIRRALKAVGKRYTIHVCFSASNIIKIASKYPQCLIVADNDSVGLNSAIKTGRPYWISPCAGEDFNDFELRVGAEVAGKSLIAIGQ